MVLLPHVAGVAGRFQRFASFGGGAFAFSHQIGHYKYHRTILILLFCLHFVRLRVHHAHFLVWNMLGYWFQCRRIGVRVVNSLIHLSQCAIRLFLPR